MDIGTLGGGGGGCPSRDNLLNIQCIGTSVFTTSHKYQLHAWCMLVLPIFIKWWTNPPS